MCHFKSLRFPAADETTNRTRWRRCRLASICVISRMIPRAGAGTDATIIAPLKTLKIEFVDVILVKDKRGAQHYLVASHFYVAKPAGVKRRSPRLQVAVDQGLSRVNGQISQIQGIP